MNIRVEEEEGAQSFPCGNADESRTHTVGECERYTEERNVSEEELRQIDGCNMESFGTLNSSEKTIVIPGEMWWPQTSEKEKDKMSNFL